MPNAGTLSGAGENWHFARICNRKGRLQYLTEFASRERTENKEIGGDVENGKTGFCHVLVSQEFFFPIMQVAQKLRDIL